MNENSKPIETVIAGLGRAGWDIHWQELLKGRPDFRVVGAIEPMAERRVEAEADIACRCYASFDDFLNDPIGQLMVLATPSGGHGDEALACLERDLHVVVDKPMCQSTAEANAMMELAEKRQRVLTCFHPMRFNGKFAVINDVMQSGRLGRIVQVKCVRNSFSRRNDWVMRKAKGSGQHNVWGSHTVDQCLQLVGSPVVAVFSDLQCTATPGDADDHCKILIKCENGTTIDVEVSNCMAYDEGPEWQVAGTCGGLISCEEGMKVRWFDPAAAPPLELQKGAAQNRKYGNDDELPWQEEIVPCPQLSRDLFYDNVAAAIGEDADLLVTPESVLHTIAVLETCRRQNPDVCVE